MTARVGSGSPKSTRPGRAGPWELDRLVVHDPPIHLAHRDGKPDDTVLIQVVPGGGEGQAWAEQVTEVLRTVTHPSIPTWVDSGKSGAWLYVATEEYEPETLADRMFIEEAPLGLACSWLLAIASGIRAMHQAGWVHADLAPHHIFVRDDGKAWVMGLGHARRLGEVAPEADLSTRVLTHLAPEAFTDPGRALPQGDIYAFGIIAFELLARKPAFPAAAAADRADNAKALLEWKSRSRELDPGAAYPDWLRSFVRSCTHPDPVRRLPDFDAVVSWLEASRPSWAPPPPTPPPAPVRELPPLVLQPPRIDTDFLAREIARQVQMAPEAPPRADLYVLVSAAAGIAVGLAFSVMLIIYIELSRLG